jgi:hypothetical protein
MITLSGMFICLAMCELCTALALAFSASATRFLWPSANSPFKEVASDVAEATVSCRVDARAECDDASSCWAREVYSAMPFWKEDSTCSNIDRHERSNDGMTVLSKHVRKASCTIPHDHKLS